MYIFSRAHQLFLLASLPVIYLLYAIYKQDKVEKESSKFLLKMFLFGFMVVPCALISELALGAIVPGDSSSVSYALIDNFFVIALSEEGFKLLFLRLGSWRSREFDYTFDGIVYAVFVSLGFALLENFMYVFMSKGGFQVALMRAVLSIPGHMCFSVPLGYYYAKAKQASLRGRPALPYILVGLIIAVCLHGFYDFALTVNLPMMIFIAFVVVMYVCIFMVIKKASREDQRL